ncbi:MAG: hypothetical protein QOK28_113, partial [Actinomycetota bacterium]
MLALRVVVGAGFLALALLAARGWTKRRDGQRLSLAVALSLMGLLGIIAAVNGVFHYRYQVFVYLSTLAFLGSGWALLLFRHSFIPLARRVLIAAPIAVAVGLIVAVVGHIPNRADPQFAPKEIAPILVIVAAWIAMVGEPIIGFWRASRNRPSAQRTRMRALSMAYASILACFIVEMSAPSGDGIVRMLANVLVLLLLPILWTGFMVPSFVRRMWRLRNDAAFREVIDSLLLFYADRVELGGRALDAALRVMGSDAGALVDGTGEVLATAGLSTSE